MIDLVPNLRATLKANTYFEDFHDAQNRFKVFKEGEAPSIESPYITIDQQPASQDQRTGWGSPVALFIVTGKDTEWPTLWEIAEEIRDTFQSQNTLAAAGDDYPAVTYQMLGKALFDNDRNPVTDEVCVSVAIQFGFDA